MNPKCVTSTDIRIIMPPIRPHLTIRSYSFDSVSNRMRRNSEQNTSEDDSLPSLVWSQAKTWNIAETSVRTTTILYSQRYQNIRSHDLSALETLSVDSEITMFLSCFVISSSFAKVMRTFEHTHFKSFSEYPCNFCGVLSPLRKIIWIDFDQSVFDDEGYDLASHLRFQLCRNADGKIATCFTCKTRKRDFSDIEPWSQEVLNVPQHSRMFLSFVKLNCNLSRIQSHSATQAHNRYFTYRTLSGILTKKIAVHSYLTSLENMYLTSNLQALHVYDGTIDTYLQSSDANPFDLADHFWEKISIAFNWLKTNNPLIRRLCSHLFILISLDDSEQPHSDDVAFAGLSFAQLTLTDQELSVSVRRPDLILNSFDFASEVRNEDHRSHRLSAETIQSSLTTLKYVISHEDKALEMLLFSHLYSNEKSAWIYQGLIISRYSSHTNGSTDFIDTISSFKSVLMKPCLSLWLRMQKSSWTVSSLTSVTTFIGSAECI